MSYGQYISTSSSSYSGDIYHTKGKLGIGTTNPQTLLHLRVEHNNFSYFPTIRLENFYPKSQLNNFWDIENNENLNFSFSEEDTLTTLMVLTKSGQLLLGTETAKDCAILQLKSTNKGILIPGLTTTQITHIDDPALGLLVYNTDINHFEYFRERWETIITKDDLDSYLSSETDPIFTAWDKDYNDLTNRPDFTGWDTDASDDFDGQWSNLTGTPPNISIFNNDAGYLTSNDVQNVWKHSGNKTYIYNEINYVGIGTNNPQTNLQIKNTFLKDEKQNDVTIRTQSVSLSPDSDIDYILNTWDIKNEKDLIFSFAQDENPILPKVTFSSNGNVGIGIDNPTTKLHIFSTINNLSDKKSSLRLQNNYKISGSKPHSSTWDITNNDNLIFSFAKNNQTVSPKITFSPTGQIGVGTDSPQATLHLKSTNNKPTIRFETKDSENFPLRWDIQQNQDKLSFIFSDNIKNTPIMTIAKSQGGNDKLTFKGTINAQKFTINGQDITSGIWQQDGDNIFYNAGNVGVGTDLPQAKLHIKDGAILIDGNMPAWTTTGWKQRIQTPAGSVWTTTENVTDKNYKIGFGMTSSGWYFIETKDDKTHRYPAVLNLDGTFTCSKVHIQEIANWADIVFDTNYNLIPINELENYISLNNHLPDIPSEQEILDNGLDVGDMQALQMQKIEELTLYIIELNKKLEEQQKEIEKLKNNK